MDLITKHLDGVEDKIDAFAFSISGMHLKEENTPEKYTLSWGIREPLEVGFYKKRHPEISNFRYSAYLKMLNVISEFITDEAEFEIWVHLEKM